LLVRVWCGCRSFRSLLLSASFCLMKIGQSQDDVQVVSRAAVHPAHCIESVKSIWACFEWRMDSEVGSDEVAKIVSSWFFYCIKLFEMLDPAHVDWGKLEPGVVGR
jgi:hypothetical protein